MCIICCVFQDLLFANLLKLKNPLSSFSTSSAMVPIDPFVWCSCLFGITMIFTSLLYGYFLDYKEANNTRMDRVEENHHKLKQKFYSTRSAVQFQLEDHVLTPLYTPKDQRTTDNGEEDFGEE